MVTDKPLPATPETEDAVLGAMLVNGDAVRFASDCLTPECFHTPANRALFAAMMQVSRAGAGVDFLAVSDALKTSGELDAVGGPTRLLSLQTNVPSTELADEWMDRLTTYAERRRLIVFAGELVEKAYDLEVQQDELMADLLEAGREAEVGRAISRPASEFIAEAKALHTGNPGLRTGLRDLDRIIRLRQSEMVVVAARPSIGKTALLLDILAYHCLFASQAGMIASMEMAGPQLVARILRAHGPRACNKAQLHIFDKPGAKVGDICVEARRLHAKVGISLVAVDYLQLVRATQRRDRTREQEVSEISATLKRLARELNVPVLVAAQINREGEDRPRISHLRESGAIEQDADIVVLIERKRAESETTLHVGKNRNGPTGRAGAHFDAEHTRFSDDADDATARGQHEPAEAQDREF